MRFYLAFLLLFFRYFLAKVLICKAVYQLISCFFIIEIVKNLLCQELYICMPYYKVSASFYFI